MESWRERERLSAKERELRDKHGVSEETLIEDTGGGGAVGAKWSIAGTVPVQYVL